MDPYAVLRYNTFSVLFAQGVWSVSDVGVNDEKRCLMTSYAGALDTLSGCVGVYLDVYERVREIWRGIFLHLQFVNLECQMTQHLPGNKHSIL